MLGTRRKNKMRSKNPKKYMKKDKTLSFSKFQPSRSPVFSQLPTTEQKQQQHENKIKKQDGQSSP
jgi:hypothetical protein